MVLQEGLSAVPPEDAAYEALRAQAQRPAQPTAHPADTPGHVTHSRPG
jgi:hypothetical protein